MYEEIYRGTISEAATHFEAHPPKGEITLVIGGAPDDAGQWRLEQIQTALNRMLQKRASVLRG